MRQPLSKLAKLHAAIESNLRRAMAEGRYITLKELYAIPDVTREATGITQVRDALRTYQRQEVLEQTDVNPKENNGDAVAWRWKEGATFVLGRKPRSDVAQPRQRVDTSPGPVAVTKYAAPDPNAVELVLNGIEIIAGVNPATGRIRIQIESPK